MNLILTLMLAATASAVADSPPSGPRTIQQDFDDASSDASAGKCESAIPKFEALERSNRVKAGSLPAAAIAVRKGICAISLWRADADESALQAGLKILDKAGASFDIDISNGWTALGDEAFRRYDYAGATNSYKNALARSMGEYRLNVLTKLAKATAFDQDAEALSYADEGVKIISVTAKPNKDSLATFHTLHARTLLNQGNAEGAYKELNTALSLSGGLTNKATLSEVALRGDLAIAAMLVGKKDDARRYLAYTGAGRIGKSPFARAVSMNPPLCGVETGIRPEDVAVVEFGIADDGSVSSARTVYSRGGPDVAAAFGKAVSEWYWKPEDIAAIPPFYRVLTRVELRCSNVLSDGPGVTGPLRERFLSWAVAYLPSTATPDMSNANLRKTLHHYIDDSSRPSNDAARIAVLGWLAYMEPVSRQKRMAMADEALALASKTRVPQEVVNWLRIVRQAFSTVGKRTSSALRALVMLSDDPAISNDALAADTLRLQAARGWRTTKLKEAPLLLEKVAQDDRLPPHHPLRQLAWLDLAGKAAERGNSALAQDYYGRTGLADKQCGLLGVPPTLKRSNVSSVDYPTDAARMGFEGWVLTEYDIMTDGKTTNVRPTIAYPPLIFVDAAAGIAKGLQYDVSFRPGSSMACSANRRATSFVIPKDN